MEFNNMTMAYPNRLTTFNLFNQQTIGPRGGQRMDDSFDEMMLDEDLNQNQSLASRSSVGNLLTCDDPYEHIKIKLPPGDCRYIHFWNSINIHYTADGKEAIIDTLNQKIRLKIQADGNFKRDYTVLDQFAGQGFTFFKSGE